MNNAPKVICTHTIQPPLPRQHILDPVSLCPPSYARAYKRGLARSPPQEPTCTGVVNSVGGKDPWPTHPSRPRAAQPLPCIVHRLPRLATLTFLPSHCSPSPLSCCPRHPTRLLLPRYSTSSLWSRTFVRIISLLPCRRAHFPLFHGTTE
jgi:hypothetical protein